MKQRANIPIFIPHLGCPHTCAFCNQHSIAGQSSPLSLPEIRQSIEQSLVTLKGRQAEIAYFGGSFTGIDREYMIALLSLAQEYVNSGQVSGIRFSTRPDYITSDILQILSHYTITAAELGVQSLSDQVLTASRRGHTASQALEAISLLKAQGIPCVGQMMLGLPASSPECERMTARLLCNSGVTAARIYPTVILRGTALEQLTANGSYTPLTVEQAVERSADILEIFQEAGVEILRVGLCAADNLSEQDAVGGAWHPALGELAYSRVCLRKMRSALAALPDDPTNHTVQFGCAKGLISQYIGQHGENRRQLREEFHLKDLKIVENDTILGYNCTVAIK